jgi:hypothetical protein
MSGKIPIQTDEMDNTDEKDDKNMLIDELKEQIAALRDWDLEKQEGA